MNKQSKMILRVFAISAVLSLFCASCSLRVNRIDESESSYGVLVLDRSDDAIACNFDAECELPTKKVCTPERIECEVTTCWFSLGEDGTFQCHEPNSVCEESPEKWESCTGVCSYRFKGCEGV